MEFNEQAVIQVNDLERIGISVQQVVNHYRVQKGIKLNLNEMIKVNSTDEGKSINFETWDQISITVPVIYSNGSPNKIEPPME